MSRIQSSVHVINLPGPNGVVPNSGRVRLTISLNVLAQEMGWKAYYNKTKKCVLKGGAVKCELITHPLEGDGHA